MALRVRAAKSGTQIFCGWTGLGGRASAVALEFGIRKSARVEALKYHSPGASSSSNTANVGRFWAEIRLAVLLARPKRLLLSAPTAAIA